MYCHVGLSIQATFQIPQDCGQGDKEDKLCSWLQSKGLGSSELQLGGNFGKLFRYMQLFVVIMVGIQILHGFIIIILEYLRYSG